MKAVTIVSFGGVEGLEVREVADAPRATLDRVRVRVRAAGFESRRHPARLGRYPAPPGYPQEFREWNSPAKCPKSVKKRAD